jgi:nucleoside-diphosphate-sugar epimerase
LSVGKEIEVKSINNSHDFISIDDLANAIAIASANDSIFGEINGTELTCSLHGWRFDLKDGKCLNAENRPLRVRRRES